MTAPRGGACYWVNRDSLIGKRRQHDDSTQSTFLLAVGVVAGQIGETSGLVSAAGQVCAAIAQAG